jgi:hypothetical protein
MPDVTAGELTTLRSAIDQLRRDNVRLHDEIGRLRSELARHPARDAGHPPDGAVGRRHLLRIAGAAAVGGIAATAAVAQPAAAGNGDPVILGTTNTATSSTRIHVTDSDQSALSAQAATPGATAIRGVATAESGYCRGVDGTIYSTTGIAVQGYSYATSGVNYGVVGVSNSDEGTAMRGIAGASTGEALGVRGESWSTSGTGVLGLATASSGTTYGVRGRAESAAGFGVYSEGPAKVDGRLTVDGRTDTTRLVARSGGAAAVDGRSTSNRGGVFGGEKAGIRLLPRAGRPASGAAGDLFVDAQNRLWFCKGGTSWTQLA